MLGEAFVACSTEAAQEHVEKLITVRKVGDQAVSIAALSGCVLRRRPPQRWLRCRRSWTAFKRSVGSCAQCCTRVLGRPLDWMTLRSEPALFKCTVSEDVPARGARLLWTAFCGEPQYDDYFLITPWRSRQRPPV